MIASVDTIEEWRPIPDYEGRYEVSNFGRARSLARTEICARGVWPIRACLLKPMLNPGGYSYIGLRKGGVRRMLRLHRIVAKVFVPGCSILHNEVAHLDGSRDNARADNLKWVSKVENRWHQMLHGTNPCGSRHGNAKLNEAQVAIIKRRLIEGAKRKALAEEFGVARCAIDSIRDGSNWRRVAPCEGSAVGAAETPRSRT